MTGRRFGVALQTALGGLLFVRPAWALWGFAVLVYGGLAARILAALVEARRLPWAPPQLVALPASGCLSTLAPPFAPTLLAVGLHLSVRRESTDTSSLVAVLLGASVVLLLDDFLPDLPGLPSDPLELGGVLWVALGLLERAGRDAARLLGTRAGACALAGGYALLALGAVHTSVAPILFHPWSYGVVLTGWVCLISDTDEEGPIPDRRDRAERRAPSRPPPGRLRARRSRCRTRLP